MNIGSGTYANWERGKTEPVASQFRPVVAFLGYDPTPEPQTLAERVEAKQRRLRASLAQVARYLGWDPGSLRRYLDGTWRMPPSRAALLDAFLVAEEAELARLWQLPRGR